MVSTCCCIRRFAGSSCGLTSGRKLRENFTICSQPTSPGHEPRRSAMTLLVTGATGHVGAEIVKQAAKLGLPVIALHRGTLSPDAQADPLVTWLRCDLTSAGEVRQLAEMHRIDSCIHAA